ncbi:MAG: dephospho-CoA kinase [Dehalococcoidales bacterium]|nr:dephospho-CoA kinase [Dehalococcoidales bacterium]MDD4323184.1 dephospho-CoA kinase [Dehalococcoidales bacterium]MDD5498953.1 dephospho-CoA kinase [Dehalococcoidales bacterium]
MKIIGLTGGLGSGKSTVAAVLAELGAHVIDADRVAHQVLAENQGVKTRLVKRFGSRILDLDDSINRSALARIVFSSVYETRFLNRLLHPLVRRQIEKSIQLLSKEGTGVLVIEAALLIEAGWQDLVQDIWVTQAPLKIRLERLEARGFSQETALERIRQQADDNKRREFAHVIIDTDTDLDSLKRNVTLIYEEYLAQ